MYLKNRVFIVLGVACFILAASYSFPAIMIVGKLILGLLAVAVLWDYLTLRPLKSQISVDRSVLPKLSLGEERAIKYQINNRSSKNLGLTLVDELPDQFQERTFERKVSIGGQKKMEVFFDIRPVDRGEYEFGHVNLFLSNPMLGLVELRTKCALPTKVKVIPSVAEMKKYELQVFSKTATLSGIRRIRRVGENDEFEHIKNYVQGDNIKAINWKATSRRGELMINEYQNTRSQMVYCIIDKGRSMKMPFNGLTLLDYAINSTLVISNIILKKYDKVGLITFSDRIGAIIKAESKTRQLERVAGALYNQTTEYKESNHKLLFYTLRRQVSRRSILLFFTNFENEYDLKRNMPYLRSLQKKHLLVVVFFINTEMIETSEMEGHELEEIYLRTFAQRALADKQRIQRLLHLQGVQTILTKPEDLSINVINRYLEIKAKRMR